MSKHEGDTSTPPSPPPPPPPLTGFTPVFTTDTVHGRAVYQIT